MATLATWMPSFDDIQTLFSSGTPTLDDIRYFGESSWFGNNFIAYKRLTELPSDINWMPFDDQKDYEEFIESMRFWIFIPMAFCFFVMWMSFAIPPLSVAWMNGSRFFSLKRLIQRSKSVDGSGGDDTWVNAERCETFEISEDKSDMKLCKRYHDENEAIHLMITRIQGTASILLSLASIGAFFWLLFKVDRMTTLISDGNLMAVFYMIAIISVVMIGVCQAILAIYPTSVDKDYAVVEHTYVVDESTRTRFVRFITPDSCRWATDVMFLPVALAVFYEGVQLTTTKYRTMSITASILFLAASLSSGFWWSLFVHFMYGDFKTPTKDTRSMNAHINSEDRHMRAVAFGNRWMLAFIASVLMCIPHDDVVFGWIQFDDSGWYFSFVWVLVALMVLVVIPVELSFFTRMAKWLKSRTNGGRRSGSRSGDKRKWRRKHSRRRRRNSNPGYTDRFAASDSDIASNTDTDTDSELVDVNPAGRHRNNMARKTGGARPGPSESNSDSDYSSDSDSDDDW